MKGNYTKVDLRIFQAIKTLLAGGATIKECADYMHVSDATVKSIKASETLEEYRAIIAAYSARKRERQEKAKLAEQKLSEEKKPEAVKDEKPAAVPEKIVEHRYDVTVQTTHYMSQKLDKIEELLKSISQKLGYICEDLYGNKKEGA